MAASDSNQIGSSRKNNFLGICCTVLASTVVAFAYVSIQYSEMGGHFSTLVMGVFGLVTGIAWFLFFNQRKLNWHLVGKIVLNGAILSSLSNYLLVLSYDYLTAGDSTSIHYYSSFAFGLVLEFFLLRLKPHWLTICCSLIGLTGLVFISQSETRIDTQFNFHGLFGFSLSLISGLINALFYIIMRQWSSVNTGLLVFASRLGCCLMPLPFVIKTNFAVPVCDFKNKTFLLLGCACFTINAFLGFKGSQLSFPSISFTVKCLSIVLCYILQVLLMEKTPHIYSIIGASLICLNIVLQSLIVLKTRKETTLIDEKNQI